MLTFEDLNTAFTKLEDLGLSEPPETILISQSLLNETGLTAEQILNLIDTL